MNAHLTKLLETALATYFQMEEVLQRTNRVAGQYAHPAVQVQAEAFKQVVKIYALLGKDGGSGKKTELENFLSGKEFEIREVKQ